MVGRLALTMKMEFYTLSDEETFALGRKIGSSLSENQLLALYGDLGSGKTTLVRGIVDALQKGEPAGVHSPTFTYLNIYEGGRLPLYHFDLYRLADARQFSELGLDEYLHAGGVCCIEWAEGVRSLLPKKRLDIILEHEGDSRKITIESLYEKICF